MAVRAQNQHKKLHNLRVVSFCLFFFVFIGEGMIASPAIWGCCLPGAVSSSGDSTPDSSDKLLQRGRRGRSIYMLLVKGEFTQPSTYLTKGFLLVTRS